MRRATSTSGSCEMVNSCGRGRSMSWMTDMIAEKARPRPARA